MVFRRPYGAARPASSALALALALIAAGCGGFGPQARHTAISTVEGIRRLPTPLDAPVDVKLTGSMSSKKVIIQPANVVSKYAKPSEGTNSSWFVYSPAWLAR